MVLGIIPEFSMGRGGGQIKAENPTGRLVYISKEHIQNMNQVR
jgi:hypothetical protein